jgi:Zn-dependent protease/predicted transcriptional regulator
MDNKDSSKGIRIFSVSGIPIYINYSWLVIFALVAWSLARFYYPSKYGEASPSAYWIMGVISSLLLFLSVLLHELAHSLMARRQGIKVTDITLFIFGGVSRMPDEPDSPGKDMLISAAGPLSSIAIALICGVLSALAPPASLLKPIFVYLTWINGALAVFNLLPGMPLDGGRILRDLVWAKTGNFSKGSYTASVMGKAVGMGLIFLGIFDFFQGNLIGGLWFVIIGIFLRSAAEQGYRQASLKSQLRGTSIAQIMTAKPISVEPSLPISSLIDKYFYQYHHVAYPVMDSDRLLGLIDLKRIKELSPAERTHLTVGDVMTGLSPDLTLAPEEEVTDVLQRLLDSAHGRLLVVKDGKLLGIISRRDIMDLLRIKMELG